MAKDYVDLYRSLLASLKPVDTAKLHPQIHLGNGKGTITLRPPIA